jgi:hypothetical protein
MFLLSLAAICFTVHVPDKFIHHSDNLRALGIGLIIGAGIAAFRRP